MKLKLLIFILVSLLTVTIATADTYYRNPTGTAANKAAATGPCTDLSACMNITVYNNETFSDGDVIVWCNQSTYIPPYKWSFGSQNISKTISIPAVEYALLETGDKILLETGDKIILQ
jgi:hypothetical protein